MPDKKLLTAAALTAALATGGVGGALLGRPLVTSAQQSDDSTTTTEELDDGGGRRHRHGVHLALEAAAEALGISVEDLRSALRDDRTIADVAEERGVDVQAVVDAVVADATERIEERVAEGDLDADRAAELEEELPQRITDVVNGEAPLGRGHHHHGSGFRRGGLEAAAEALGMEVDELRDAVRDGRTIAEVAQERGVDVQAVVDAMVADATERIDERAAEAKEELPERISDLVNGD